VTPEERERLEAISDALARMARRQQEMEGRLARLEGGARGDTGAQAGAQSLPDGRGSEKPAETQAEAQPDAQARGPRNFEAAFGLTWVSRIAVVTVVLALAFFFEYAFERRWMTETARVLLGLGCGAAALAFGERFWRTGQEVYGQALTAAGLAFVYLSFWAAFGLYHLISQPAAFGLMALATVTAGALALRYNAVAAAVLGLAGGYATPLLLAGAQDPGFVLGYALLLDLGAAFAARARRWRWLDALAVAGTAALYIGQLPVPGGMEWLYTVFVLAYYGLFATSEFLPVFLAAQLTAGLALAGMWAPAAGGLWLAWVVAEGGLAVADRREWQSAAAVSFAGFWLAWGSWQLGSGAPAPVWPAFIALTASYALFLAWPAWRVLARGRVLRLADLALMALNTGFYFGAGYGLLRGPYSGWEGVFAAAAALAQFALARALWRRDARGPLLAAAAGGALLVLAAPIQFVGYRVSIAWALEAAAAAWIGVRLEERWAVRASGAIFALLLGRLAFVDSRAFPSSAGYAAVANVRFLTFAAAAAAFWAAAWWIRRGKPAMAAYIGGHAVLLWGLCLEAAGWAGRSAAPENLRSVTSLSISVLAGAYAVLLVAGGAARRHAPTRVLGAALIAAVVLKLYCYDIWLLGAFYRMASFAILGVLLWVMAYLYSRFRASIGGWWRP
jgi:uncharacterized membrane protein